MKNMMAAAMRLASRHDETAHDGGIRKAAATVRGRERRRPRVRHEGKSGG
jgi:hypothetical protein